MEHKRRIELPNFLLQRPALPAYNLVRNMQHVNYVYL